MPAHLTHLPPPLRATAHKFLAAHMPFPSLRPTSRKHQQMDSIHIALRQMCLLLPSLSRCQKSLKLLLLLRGRLVNQPAVMRHHQKLPRQLQCMKPHTMKVVWDHLIQQLTQLNPPLLPPAVLDQILIVSLQRQSQTDLFHRLQHSHHRHH